MKYKNANIGFFGVVIAVLLVFFIRGCAISEEQDNINSFCLEKGFEYGVEEVKNTIIVCATINESSSSKYSFLVYEQYLDKIRELEKNES